jgi:hypothetical protein
LDEHYDQVFHLARKYCIIPGWCRQLELFRTDTGYLPQEYHTHEEIEGDSGWSCGPFTIVKVLETLLQLERNGKTKFLGNRAQFRLETESWKVLKRQVVGQQLIEQTICYLIHLTHQPSQQVNILSSWNSLASSDNDKHSRGYVSVGKF